MTEIISGVFIVKNAPCYLVNNKEFEVFARSLVCADIGDIVIGIYTPDTFKCITCDGLVCFVQLEPNDFDFLFKKIA